jgi:hypothetical protein
VGPGRCECCDREADELHVSFAAGAICCERCHSRAAPPASAAARRYRQPKSPPPPPLGPYGRLVGHIWTRLEERTEMPVFTFGNGRIAAYCPVCRTGTLAVQFIDAPGGPEWGITSSAGEDQCDLGCTFEQVREALDA